jgi:hypothetical protein
MQPTMENLKKKQRTLRAVIIIVIAAMVIQMRKSLDQIPIPLFLMIFAAGVATGSLIVVSRMIRAENAQKKLEE